MAAATSRPQSDDPPLVQLVTSLHKEQYKFSKEEAEVLAKCNGRMKTYGVEGFLAAGTTVWAVTGSLTLVQRLTATLAGATAGGVFLAKWAVGYCMKEILALEGSPMQERFAAILQKEAVHRPHIRSLLEKYYYMEPLYDDTGQNTDSFVMRKRESADLGLKKLVREEDQLGEASSALETVKNAAATQTSVNEKPTLEESKENAIINRSQVHGIGHAQSQGEVSDDPFDMLWKAAADEESSKPGMKAKSVEKRKGKMGVLERRERNRARYLEWQEKQNTGGWGDSLSELGSVHC